MDAKSLSIKELHPILLALSLAEVDREEKLKTRIQTELGKNAAGTDSSQAAMKILLLERSSHLMAYRLKRNNQSVPLISPADFKKVVSELLKTSLGNAEAEIFDPEWPKKLKRFLVKLMQGFSQEISELPWVPSGKNPYEKTWATIQAVLDLAEKHGIKPAEVPGVESLRDDLTRQAISKEEYTDRAKRILAIYGDFGKFKSLLLEPLVELVSEDEDLAETLQGVESRLGEELSDSLKKAGAIASSFIDAEISRIYG